MDYGRLPYAQRQGLIKGVMAEDRPEDVAQRQNAYNRQKESAQGRLLDLQNNARGREKQQSADYQAQLAQSRVRQLANPRNNYIQAGIQPGSERLIGGGGNIPTYQENPVEIAQRNQAIQKATLNAEQNRGMIKREMAKRGLSGTSQEKTAIANIDAQEQGSIQSIAKQGTFNRIAFNQAIGRGYGAEGRALAEQQSRFEQQQQAAGQQREWQGGQNEANRQLQRDINAGKQDLTQQGLEQKKAQFDKTNELKDRWLTLAQDKQDWTEQDHADALQFKIDLETHRADLAQQALDLKAELGRANTPEAKTIAANKLTKVQTEITKVNNMKTIAKEKFTERQNKAANKEQKDAEKYQQHERDKARDVFSDKLERQKDRKIKQTDQEIINEMKRSGYDTTDLEERLKGQPPTEQKPAEQKPAEQKPAEQKPAEQKKETAMQGGQDKWTKFQNHLQKDNPYEAKQINSYFQKLGVQPQLFETLSDKQIMAMTNILLQTDGTISNQHIQLYKAPNPAEELTPEEKLDLKNKLGVQ